MLEIFIEPTFASWQREARRLLHREVPPDQVTWTEQQVERGGTERLFTPSASPAPPTVADATADAAVPFRVPRRFVESAEIVARHPATDRWALLYRMLWRLVHESRTILDAVDDPDVRRLAVLEREIRQGLVAPVRSPVTSARPFVPSGADLAGLADASRSCTGCDLYRKATQVVFGRGPARAQVVLVGEQPGDQEDVRGQPFVGPAGEVLDRALVEARIERATVYVTNAVKHFKWEPRGKRRIHQTPTAIEVQACRPWLEAELSVIRPSVVVCLGSTASQALLGPQFRVLRGRGKVLKTNWAPALIATIHPSAVLRTTNPAGEAEYYRMLVDDLRLAASALASARPD
jgi:DNA polymerase